MKSRHPGWLEIVEAVEHGAPGGALGDHVKTCPLCGQWAAEVRGMLETFRDAADSRPPEALMERTWIRLREALEATKPTGAQRLAAGLGRLAERAGSRIRDVWAALVADSLRPSLAVRGSTVATPRALVYETDDFAVSLSFTHDPKRKRLHVMGQVIPKGSVQGSLEGGRVEIGAGEDRIEAPLSAHGEFRFRDISSAAPLELSVLLRDQRIRFEPLRPLDAV
jgi:hypothetical protein